MSGDAKDTAAYHREMQRLRRLRGSAMTDLLADAEAAQASLQRYGGNVEDGGRDGRTVALAICLAADAVCEYLGALVRAVEGTE